MPMPTREAQNAYQREWVAKRRAAYFADKSCVQCGSTDDLELDHIDPRTKVNNSIWSWSVARQESELIKCQVLCATCHGKKSIEQMPLTHGFVPYSHGTCKTYYRGCRCEACRLWRRQKNARNRKPRKIV